VGEEKTVSLFKKKNEELQEEEIEEGLNKKLSPAPVAKRTRKPKEPIKPWTKKERMFIFYVLLFSVVMSGILGLTARNWKAPGLPRFDISLPNDLSFSKTVVIENPNKAKYKEVVDNFRGETDKLSGVYGLYVVRLSNNDNYGVNETQEFQAASLMKLPVFITLYQKAQKGEVNLDSKYTLKEEDKVGGSGSLQYKKAGTVLTYRKMAELMGKESDNTSFKILRAQLGDSVIDDTISAIGMANTDLSENMTTPEDIGILFRKLWNNELVEENYKQEILGYLSDTIYEDHLVKGIPQNIQVAHKYGREVHVVNDAGIVMSSKPYVVVIMSDGVVESQADTNFPKLSQLIFDFENR
jgi:beta-lactamase class A